MMLRAYTNEERRNDLQRELDAVGLLAAVDKTDAGNCTYYIRRTY